MKVALRNEIKEGPAQVLTTLEGEEPSLYNIEIQKLLSQDKPGPKSMIIKVTDQNLIKNWRYCSRHERKSYNTK